MAATTVANFDGWFKKRYAKQPQSKIIPEHYKLLKNFPSLAGLSPVGEEYVVPVSLADGSGFTYANSGSEAFALEPADPGRTLRAKLTANQIVYRDAIAWEAQSISEEGYDSAYGVMTDIVVRRMRKRFMHRLECELLYGGTALGKVSAATAGTSLTMAASDWSVGAWMGAENQWVDVYNSSTLRGSFKITAVDPDNYKLYGATPAGISANDTLYWKGAKGNQMTGIYTALNTAGTLWNISNDVTASGYSLWKGNTVTVSGAMTWDNYVQKATEKATNKGAEGELFLMVNPSSWRGLMNDEAGLRAYDKSYDPSKAKQGFEDIEFHGQNGIIRVMAYPMLKNGDALLLAKDSWIRIGSQDVTFRPPGVSDKDVWIQQMQNNAGFQITMYTNQTIFSDAPGQSTLFSGITPS
jgi:hypothetical protein